MKHDTKLILIFTIIVVASILLLSNPTTTPLYVNSQTNPLYGFVPSEAQPTNYDTVVRIIPFAILWFFIVLLCGWWLYTDAKMRRKEPQLWILFVILTGPIAVLFWIVTRPKKVSVW